MLVSLSLVQHVTAAPEQDNRQESGSSLVHIHSCVGLTAAGLVLGQAGAVGVAAEAGVVGLAHSLQIAGLCTGSSPSVLAIGVHPTPCSKAQHSSPCMKQPRGYREVPAIIQYFCDGTENAPVNAVEQKWSYRMHP